MQHADRSRGIWIIIIDRLISYFAAFWQILRDLSYHDLSICIVFCSTSSVEKAKKLRSCHLNIWWYEASMTTCVFALGTPWLSSVKSVFVPWHNFFIDNEIWQRKCFFIILFFDVYWWFFKKCFGSKQNNVLTGLADSCSTAFCDSFSNSCCNLFCNSDGIL